MSAWFDLGEELAGSLSDSGGAWRFIRRFAESWLTPLTDADGWTEADLRAAEERLKVGLPAALREAYGLFGRRKDLTSVQDRLLGPNGLVVDQAGEVLVFRRENQGCTCWGVPMARLDRPDPPVVFWLDARDPRQAGWRPFLERFSLACVELVLYESMFSAPLELGDNRDLDAAAAALLEQRFARLAFPDYPLWAVPDGPPMRWFGGADVLLRDDAGSWLWVRGRTTAALATVRAALPGDWVMVAD